MKQEEDKNIGPYKEEAIPFIQLNSETKGIKNEEIKNRIFNK